MTPRKPTTPAPLREDQPLPGMRECLTLQLNATLYRAGKTLRFVVILRDPDRNEELSRTLGGTQPLSPESVGGVEAAFRSMIDLAAFQLHGTDEDIKRAHADQVPPRGARKSTPRKAASPPS